MHDVADREALLRSVSIFATFSDAARAAIARLLTDVIVAPDEILCRAGDAGDSLFIVVDGLIRVHDDDRTLNHLGNCEVFGEVAALDPRPRSVSVTAVEPTRLLRLGSEPLWELVRHDPDVAEAVIRVLCDIVRRRVHDVVEDSYYLQQVARLTAAAEAVQAGTYVESNLDTLADLADPLGQLARVFQDMAQEVVAREAQLRHEVQHLRIEIDQARQERQVAEIVDTEYFARLKRQLGTRRRPQRRTTDQRPSLPGHRISPE
jgi:CRP-like cAMP-binding protein